MAAGFSWWQAKAAARIEQEGKGPTARFWLILDGRPVGDPMGDRDEAEAALVEARAVRALVLAGWPEADAAGLVADALDEGTALRLDRVAHRARAIGKARGIAA